MSFSTSCLGSRDHGRFGCALACCVASWVLASEPQPRAKAWSPLGAGCRGMEQPTGPAVLIAVAFSTLIRLLLQGRARRPAHDRMHARLRPRRIGDERKVPAQLDHAGEVATLVPSAADRIDGRFVNNKHRRRRGVHTSRTGQRIPSRVVCCPYEHGTDRQVAAATDARAQAPSALAFRSCSSGLSPPGTRPFCWRRSAPPRRLPDCVPCGPGDPSPPGCRGRRP